MTTNYQPSAYYFRRELRNAKTKDAAIQVGMRAILELEMLKEWVRSKGMIPPKLHVPASEADAKGWTDTD